MQGALDGGLIIAPVYEFVCELTARVGPVRKQVCRGCLAGLVFLFQGCPAGRAIEGKEEID